MLGSLLNDIATYCVISGHRGKQINIQAEGMGQDKQAGKCLTGSNVGKRRY